MTQWECQCDCGAIIKKTTSDIRQGKTQCWDCAHKLIGEKKRKNLESQTFGYLTVISIDRRKDKNGKQRAYCFCKCKCGNEVTVPMETLMSKYELHSCGCARKEIAGKHLSRKIVGQKFNRLTVIEEYAECTPREVLCKCDCGKTIRAIKISVMAGATKSCGCLRSERTAQSNYKDRTGYVSEFGITINKPLRQNEHGVWVYDCTCFCGNHFEDLPVNVISGHRKSCGCLLSSSGEKLIEKYLHDNRIKYQAQYTFEDCKDISLLKFDFAILRANETVSQLIEYDGKQHYEATDFFGGEEAFKKRKEHDIIKDKYCLAKGIPLLRLPYTLSVDEIKEQLANIKLL